MSPVMPTHTPENGGAIHYLPIEFDAENPDAVSCFVNGIGNVGEIIEVLPNPCDDGFRVTVRTYDHTPPLRKEDGTLDTDTRQSTVVETVAVGKGERYEKKGRHDGAGSVGVFALQHYPQS